MARDAATRLPPLPPAAIGRPLFLSPHLDDAAFACGRLLASLADPVVATVFAGAAPAGAAPSEWDRAAGFGPGQDVVGVRRAEDRQALTVLGAWPLWLDLCDCQYAPPPPLADVVTAVRRLLMQCEPDAVFFPLGLFHSDHRLTRQAAVAVLQACPSCRWFAYEDALYRRLPGELDAGLAALRRAGLALSPVHFAEAAAAAARKRRAVVCYRSQLHALATSGRPGTADLAEAEGYWQVAPR